MSTDLVKTLRREVAGLVVPNAPLAPLNTFGIGGPAAVLVQPAHVNDVVHTLLVCRDADTPLYVLGAGSNVIVPDAGVQGVVLRLTESLCAITWREGLFIAGAGVLDGDLARFALQYRRTGFEWIDDIPGSVGGAVYMNAGNNDGEISDTLRYVRWVTPAGTLEKTSADELDLGYRSSRFQKVPGIIVEAAFEPGPEDSAASIRDRMDGIRNLRQSKFPEETLCAGSIFKRPPGHYAGRLIEEAGCGGMRVGDAIVSEKHKGFIVNLGRATAKDVLALIEQVRDRVLVNSGIRLQTEVEELRPLAV